jgi:C-terminal processing protease CtpA/Prc
MKIKSKSILINLLVVVLVISLFLPLAGCQEKRESSVSEQMQIENLEKLCRVWGYVKYTHPVFLLGEKDWDEELLKLIPQVQKCKNSKKVNQLLHDWFVSLGDIDYGTNSCVPIWAGSKEGDKVVQADTAWISDTSYLGEKLSDDLSQLKVVPNINRTKAPVKFVNTYADFSNEKTYADMDYSNTSYRLLGLFRLWNAMEYYYPYLDILDEDWGGQLSKYIPKMMAGEDKQSYQLTIAAVSVKLQDAHVSMKEYQTFFGEWYTPIILHEAEGKIVVADIFDSSCPLKIGDIVLKIDDRNVEDKIEELKEYIPISSDNKLEAKLFQYLLLSQSSRVTYTVLRDGKEKQVIVQACNINNSGLDNKILLSHERLDGNIGLINPSKLEPDEIFSIMKEFKDTNGLIIDMRQYPSEDIMHSLAQYIVQKPLQFVIVSKASQAVPGTFIKSSERIVDASSYDKSKGIYNYDRNVVVLMDENSVSSSEYTIMSFRTGKNVTVMGEESIGADGNVAYLPLPGQMSMRFTGMGVYTPEGGQTQRIGLSPDIRVERTIQGIKDGRDELMEAAIQYLKKNK